jgi:hypothetical protein
MIPFSLLAGALVLLVVGATDAALNGEALYL